MPDVRSNALERDDGSLHPALASFLHPDARAVGAASGDELADQVDRDDAAPAAADDVPIQALLISPPCPFANTITKALRNIDADCHITRTAQLTPKALASLRTGALALIDIDALPANAEALIHRITGNGVRALALSESLDRKSVDRAFEAGAVAYLPKSYSASMVEAVVRLVLEGAHYKPVQLVDKPREAAKRGRPAKLRENTPAVGDPAACLTAREKEVLLEIARGYSSLDIGRHLNMKEGTVKTHLYAIYKKINVRNRAGAALFAASMAQIQEQQMRDAETGELNPGWLLPDMTHRRMRAGEVIFRLGDEADGLFYVQSGKVHFPELDATVGSGEVFGEIGIFSPEHKRTSSAVCQTDVDLFSLTSEQVRRVYFGNPQFAIFILTLVATRLADGRCRLPERPEA